MALSRTATMIRLKAELGSGLFYDVALVDKSEAQDGSVIIPEADPESGSAGDSSAYVALVCADDDQIYRWSLTDEEEVTDWVRISPDQAETPLSRIDLQFDGEWYRVIVRLLPDGDGGFVPSLTTGPGIAWTHIRSTTKFGLKIAAVQFGLTIAKV
jgi:hypothetical protein